MESVIRLSYPIWLHKFPGQYVGKWMFMMCPYNCCIADPSSFISNNEWMSLMDCMWCSWLEGLLAITIHIWGSLCFVHIIFFVHAIQFTYNCFICTHLFVYILLYIWRTFTIYSLMSTRRRVNIVIIHIESKLKKEETITESA